MQAQTSPHSTSKHLILLLIAVAIAATAAPVAGADAATTPEPLFLNFLRPEMSYVAPPPPDRNALGFTITLNFTGGLTAAQQAAFTVAKERWESRITGYQPGISLSGITIEALGEAIDGAGGILGSAGPTTYTVEGGYSLTVTGRMRFDTADIPNMEAAGTFDEVIEHEMGHVIGIGIWWGDNTGYVNDSGEYYGASGLAAWQAEFVGQDGATFVPVELQGGAGTANGHWNENNNGSGTTGIVDALGNDMQNELMTGWLNAPVFYSDTTHQHLMDLGFTVTGSHVPTGACCQDDGSCSELSEAACLVSGGAYRGDGTTCAGTTCPVVTLLYDQTANYDGSGYSTQDFEVAYDGYDAEGADDFFVDWAGGWNVTKVVFLGGYSDLGGPLSQAHLTIYADGGGGLPGTVVCSHSSVTVQENPTGIFSLNLPSECALSLGTYWVNVQGRMDVVTSGQFFWVSQTVQTGNEGVWRNPGGAFGLPCTSWGAVTACSVDYTNPDFAFQIHGHVGESLDIIFMDGFESGGLGNWSSTVP